MMNIDGDQRLPRQEEKESLPSFEITNNNKNSNKTVKSTKRKRKGGDKKEEEDALTKVSSMLLKSRSKYQNHYAPVIPLTPEEEAEWRRECRRKRNRDSAAASRQKVRTKIQDLEQEVQEWKSKYDALFQKMTAMEQIFKSTMSSVTPDHSHKRARVAQHSQIPLDTLSGQQEAPVVSPSQSPTLQPRPVHFIPETLSQGWGNPFINNCHRDDVVSNRHINEVQSRQA